MRIRSFALASIVLVALTAIATGISAHQRIIASLIPSELGRLKGHAAELAATLGHYGDRAKETVLALTGNDAFTRRNQSTAPSSATDLEWKGRLSHAFEGELRAKSWIHQLRLLDDHGVEQVRVDRSGPDGDIQIVADDLLQSKSDRDYFIKGIALPKGDVYLSNLDLNQEHGKVQVPHVPVLRAATPVIDRSGKPLGLIVINVDMRNILQSMQSSLHTSSRVYVVDSSGQFLLHPDEPSREFASGQSASSRWPASFGLSDSVRVDSLETVTDAPSGGRLAIVGVTTNLAPSVSVLETAPYAEVIGRAGDVVQSAWWVAAVAGLGATGLGLLMARASSQALRQFRSAADRFANDKDFAGLLPRKGDFGEIAKSFSLMAQQVRLKADQMRIESDNRERAVAALASQRNQQRKYLAVIESSADAIVTMDTKGVVTSWNTAAEHLYEYSASEAIGQRIEFIVPEDLLDETASVHARALKGERVSQYETRRISQSGRMIDVSLSVSPIVSEVGEVVGVAKIAHDIAPRLEADTRFRVVLEQCPSGVCIVDASGRITLVNRELERLFGYPREELLRLPVDRLVPQWHAGQQLANHPHYMLASQGRPTGARRLFGLRKDGTEVPIEIALNPISTRGEQGTLCLVADITHRLRAEESLRESEGLLRAVVETAVDGILTIDERGIVRTMNPAAERIFGYPREEVIGRNVNLLMPQPYQGQHDSYLANYRNTGERKIIGIGREVQGQRKDGTVFPLELAVSETQLDDRRIFTGLVRDITARKQAEQELSSYAARLERSNKELQQFAYVVSHDIKAPLRGITSVAQWLSKDFGHLVDDDARENIRLMLERTTRLSALINGILDYSRAGREVTRTSIAVSTLLEDIVASIECPPHISIVLQGPFPTVTYNETQLRQVFQNLIVNAITHLGKPSGHVVVSCRETSTEFSFSIADNGVGIAERHFQRIFELFQTLRPKDESHTTGAGLAIVKRIVESNGGDIRVASQEGAGATFTFSVPVAVDPVARHNGPKEQPP